MYSSQIVAERIRKVVKENNTTMDKLNSECNLSKNAISSASKSSEGMKAKNLYMIAEFLEVSVDYLLGRTDTSDTAFSETKDEMSAEILKRFNCLSFDKKLDVFNYIKTLSETETTCQK